MRKLDHNNGRPKGNKDKMEITLEVDSLFFSKTDK